MVVATVVQSCVNVYRSCVWYSIPADTRNLPAHSNLVPTTPALWLIVIEK